MATSDLGATADGILNPPSVAPEEGDFLKSLDDQLASHFKNEEPPERKPGDPENEKPRESVQDTEEESDDYEIPTDENETPWWKQKKQGQAFAEVKGQLKSEREKLETLTKEIEELRAKAGVSEELEKKIQERDDRLAAFDIRSTETWKTEIAKPLNAAVQKAKALGGEALVQAFEINDLKARNEKISEIVEDLDAASQRQVQQVANTIEEIMEKMDDLQDNAATKLAEIREKEAKQKVQESKDRMAAHSQATDTVFSKLGVQLPFLKDPDTNGLTKDAAAMIERVRNSDLVEANPTVRAYAAFAGEVFVPLVKNYSETRRELAEVKAKLREYEEAEPGAGGGGSPKGGSGGGGSQKSDGGFLDAIESGIKKAGSDLRFGG